jgi:hypothetical protein
MAEATLGGVPARTDTEASTREGQGFNRSSKDILYMGGPGETVTLNFTSLILHGSDSMTLEGTATTKFVIEIQKQFSLAGYAKIVLSNGLLWNNVTFDLVGRDGRFRMRGHSELSGIVDGPQRAVTLTNHSIVYGEVFVRRLRLRRFARIITPPVISP